MSEVTIQQRLIELRKAQQDLPNILKEVAKSATMEAIQATKDATPPKAGTGRGPYIGRGTITGKLKAAWDTDSVAEPEIKTSGSSTEYETVLANNTQYASYVNDGHRLDRHFVPGLYVNEAGILEYDPNSGKGITVGTKTAYVKGEFMADKGKQAYKKAVERMLKEKTEVLLQ